MKKIKIGLLGLSPENGNLGCQALTYSAYNIFSQLLEKYDVDFYFYEAFSFKKFLSLGYIGYKKKYFKHFKKDNFAKKLSFFKNRKNRILFAQKCKKMDLFIDFTYGDSFSDLYGQKRFDTLTTLKEFIINSRIPLILGSQTYGPYFNKTNKERAKNVVKESQDVFARDILSFNYIKDEFGRTPILTTDVAFFLDYNHSKTTDCKSIGFNPSGLLWNEANSDNNKFGLTLDYRDFCKKSISIMINEGYKVHLIGHVLNDDVSSLDNDFIAIRELHKLFPQTIVAPVFETPMQAKSYISTMSFFIGARMHATIAAISSGVPVLPFSYSRKFEGLFETLDYRYLIHGKSDSLDTAILKINRALTQIDTYKACIGHSSDIINSMKKDMLSLYQKSIFAALDPDEI